jgi:hypothetical protein
MTVEVARRRTRKTKAAPPSPSIAASESISIGEIEQTVFSCPNCQRPLAIGARHCPGCRTHLVARVQLSKASMFVAIGLVAGLALGGAVGGAALVADGATRDAEIAAAVSAALAAANVKPAPVASTLPAATSRPLATAKPAGGATGIPALARSAMIQTATVHANMAAAIPVLQGALAAKDFDTYTVFQVLRSVSGDAVTGRQLAAHVGAWSGGEELATSLATFYMVVQSTAGEGLDASIRNKPAYQLAAAQMVELLGGLAAVDEQLRAVAAGAGVTIPAPVAP